MKNISLHKFVKNCIALNLGCFTINRDAEKGLSLYNVCLCTVHIRFVFIHTYT